MVPRFLAKTFLVALFTKIKFTILKSVPVGKDGFFKISHSPFLRKKSFHLLEETMNMVLFENLKVKNRRRTSQYFENGFLNRS